MIRLPDLPPDQRRSLPIWFGRHLRQAVSPVPGTPLADALRDTIDREATPRMHSKRLAPLSGALSMLVSPPNMNAEDPFRVQPNEAMGEPLARATVRHILTLAGGQ